MNWEAIGAVGEVVGALAVVMSLIYVGIQIRQSNQLARAGTFHGINTHYSSIMSQISGDEGLARICRKVKGGEELDPDELERYTAFLNSYFAMLEDVYIQQESGLYAVEIGGSNITNFLAPQYKRFLNTEQTRGWLETEGKEVFSPAFYERVLQQAAVRQD